MWSWCTSDIPDTSGIFPPSDLLVKHSASAANYRRAVDDLELHACAESSRDGAVEYWRMLVPTVRRGEPHLIVSFRRYSDSPCYNIRTSFGSNPQVQVST
jgi:hypothetical protein